MPNYCYADIHVKGYKTSVEEFIARLEANYNYNTEEFSPHKHFFRIFDVNVYDDYFEGMDDIPGNMIKRADINIECAWSVNVCMFPGPLTYYDDFLGERSVEMYDAAGNKYSKEQIEMQLRRRELAQEHATNILETCRELELDVEIVSEEECMSFSEHYFVNHNGEIELDECHDLQYYYLEEYYDKEDGYNEFIKDEVGCHKDNPDYEDELRSIVTEEIYNKCKSEDEYAYRLNDPFEDDLLIDNMKKDLVDMCIYTEKGGN